MTFAKPPLFSCRRDGKPESDFLFHYHSNPFYALQVAPTLFGEWVQIDEWGRVGCPGTIQQAVFQSLTLAEDALAKRQTVKIRRGYLGSLHCFKSDEVTVLGR